MAYTVLARRYRSGTFDEVVGQNHIAQTLKRAIESGRVAHAFMFCGTRGTGKTSMARILAKALNCESSDKPTVTPCSKCRSCEAIARGEDIDVIEIDAASNRGIDEVRRIIENSRLAPARSRFKVYIIDEVHAMSKDAFNALLKVLEEPAPHVKFILATTEPEKVLPTILSRCQRYDFHNIPTREIAAHLKIICQREGVAADDDALMLIAKAGAGSMRDAISVLDRLLSAGEKTLSAEMIEQMLGLPRSQLIFDLVQHIGQGDTKSALTLVNRIVFHGLAMDSLLASLIDHVRNLLVIRTCGTKSELVEVFGVTPEEMEKQAGQFDPVMLSQDIVILEELRRTARQSQAARALLDATIVRLTLAEQFTPIDDLLEQNASAAADPAAKKKDNPPLRSASLPAAISAPPSPAPTPSPSPATSSSDDSVDDGDALPAVGKVWDDGPKRSLSEILAEANRRQPSAPAVSVSVRPAVSHLPHDVADFWNATLQRVGEILGTPVKIPLESGQVTRDNQQVIVRFGGPFAAMASFLEKHRDQVRQIVCDVTSEELSLRFEVDESSQPTIPATPGRPRTNSPATPAPAPARPEGVPITPELRDQLTQDPLIRAVIQTFNATIVKVQ